MTESSAVEQGWYPTLRPGTLLRRDEIRETDLLVMPERAVVLNATGAAILELCDGRRAVAGVIEECRRRFSQGFSAEDVVDFLAVFRERGWLV